MLLTSVEKLEALKAIDEAAIKEISYFVSTHNFYDFEPEDAQALSIKYGASLGIETELFTFIAMLCSQSYIDKLLSLYVKFIKDPSLVNKWKAMTTSVCMHEMSSMIALRMQDEDLEYIKTYMLLTLERAVEQYTKDFLSNEGH